MVKPRFAKKILSLLVMALILGSSISWAHTPICDCYDNGDNTITCEGGFSDGGSAAGIAISVVDESGRVLIQGEMSDYSDYTFDKPMGNYFVEYHAGEGHEVVVDGRDIEE